MDGMQQSAGQVMFGIMPDTMYHIAASKESHNAHWEHWQMLGSITCTPGHSVQAGGRVLGVEHVPVRVHQGAHEELRCNTHVDQAYVSVNTWGRAQGNSPVRARPGSYSLCVTITVCENHSV